jgi:type II secretion system protein N
MLTGKPQVAFDVTVGDGTLEGSYAQRGEAGWAFEAELDGFDLGRLGIGGTLGIPLAGKATGTIAIEAGERVTEDEGEIRLKIDGLVLGDGKNKVPIPGMGAGLTVDPIDAGTLTVEVAIRQGVASIERLEAEGKDLELKASGAIRPVRPLERVRLDLTLELGFADAYKGRNDRTRALFDLLGSQPLVKRATTADGKIRLRVSGAPDSLRSRPAGAARAKEASAVPKPD